MRIPLRSVALGFGTGAVVLIAATAWMVTRVAVVEAMYEEGRKRLIVTTGLGAEQLGASRGFALDSVAGALALATGYRVSVFDADLGLLADSDLGSGPLDTVSDRRRRTEVAGALLRVSAASRRPSLLDGRDYLFSAARVYWEGESVVIRFGDPADPIRDAAARVANVAGAGVLAAGLVVLILA